jgi:tubulin polyglutamylase TTLL11
MSQNVDLVVQRYVTDPLLIENKKFDLRLYMILKGVDKIEVFLCQEGMARFCTSDYVRPIE